MSADQTLPDYDALERELHALEVPGAAEAHGVIAGVVSSPRPGREAWLSLVLGDANAAVDSAAAESMLDEVQDYTEARLAGRESQFTMLLPEEQRDLVDRVNALADFCRGFLAGLAAGGVSDLASLPGDAREVIEDFIKIAEAEADGRTSEVEERAYAEINEYVRVGVQVVYEELHGG